MAQDNTNPKGRITKIELIIFGFLFMVVLLLSALSLFCEYYPFSQGASSPEVRDLLLLSMFMNIPIMYGSLCVVLAPAALIACLFLKKVWRIRIVLFSILVVMCLLVEVGMHRLIFQFKRNACTAIVSRGQVLVDAISSYQRDHNSFPESLEALVPAYIDKIPETGIRGFPYFEYEILNPAERRYPIPEMGNKPIYELRVKLERLFKWDRLFYWPVEKYPAFIYGGDVEKNGNWAYVNE